MVGGADPVRPPYVEPVVLADVSENSRAVTEETFGPTLTVHRVTDLDEAVDRLDAGRYGLGAAVFSRRRGEEVAARLRCGMVSVNSVISFAGVPSLPFGGVGDSGFGRIHGEDGLKEFTRAKAITRQNYALPINLMSFGRPASAADALARVMGMVHGRHR